MNFSYFLFLFGALSYANTDIYVDVSQDSIYVGDKVQLIITVNNPDIEIVKFPELEVDNKDLSLLTLFSDNNSIKLSLQFWKEGSHNFPSIKINIKFKDKSSEVFSTEPIEFIILQRGSGIEDNLRESKQIKILRLPITTRQLILTLLLLITIISIYIILSKKQKLDKKINTIKNINILNDAIAKIDNIKLPNKITNRELENFYIALTDAIKEYLMNRFFFSASKMTTDEILTYLRLNSIPHQDIESLLQEADLCKFAQKKYGATKLIEDKKTAKSIIIDLERSA